MESDVVVVGSGFAGSLLALLLQRIGLRTILIDRVRHPRFAIGESSTPIGNLILRDLGKQFGVPLLQILSRYGTWREELPQVACGRKRGFSYFHHTAGTEFQPHTGHDNELLVAASRDDLLCDTHWYRPDTDTFFARAAEEEGVTFFEETELEQLHRHQGQWLVSVADKESHRTIAARFLVDATGRPAAVARQLGVSQNVETMRTRTRAIYGHFVGVGSCQEWFENSATVSSDHPFHCDAAAQHHLLDDAWCWVLRFDNGITSVGIELNLDAHSVRPQLSPQAEWNSLLRRYPSLQNLLQGAAPAALPGSLQATGPLQRRLGRTSGPGWIALPATAGFVSPLHSTGIAHSLVGIERLLQVFRQSWDSSAFEEGLRDYSECVTREFDFIDTLVSGCLQSLHDFPTFVSYSMLYFAAATSYELSRLEYRPTSELFLCAGRPALRDVAEWAYQETVGSRKSEWDAKSFETRLAARLKPFNHVGLFEPATPHMYHYTATD